MIHDLVDGIEGAAADDVAGALLLAEGEGILAHVFNPDVLEHAVSLTVDALDLVGADDAVAERAAGRDDEDGVLGACVALVVALHPAVILLSLAVELALHVLCLLEHLRRAAEFEGNLRSAAGTSSTSRPAAASDTSAGAGAGTSSATTNASAAEAAAVVIVVCGGEVVCTTRLARSGSQLVIQPLRLRTSAVIPRRYNRLILGECVDSCRKDDERDFTEMHLDNLKE